MINGNIWSAYGLDRLEYIEGHRFACHVMSNPLIRRLPAYRLVFVLLHDVFIASACFYSRVDEMKVFGATLR